MKTSMKKFALTTHSSRSFFSQHWSHAVKPGCLAMALLVASALPAMAQTPAGGGKQQTTESQTPEKKVIYRGVVIDDYNPQNEMFWHFRTKCSFSKTKRTS